jgi:hypothetical protein
MRNFLCMSFLFSDSPKGFIPESSYNSSLLIRIQDILLLLLILLHLCFASLFLYRLYHHSDCHE